MKKLLLLSCIALAACGARSERAESRQDDFSRLGGVLQRAFASTSDEKAFAAPSGGGLCGDPMLVGETVGAVAGPGACGVENAVSLRQVGDITLTQPATITCDTARALRQWVDSGAIPAMGTEGGGIAQLKVAAHYACRTRNHQRGAKVSEHGKGRAVDISAVILADGTEVTLIDHWGSRSYGKQLRAMWKAACGPFGTVLGPESDRFHKDHFHFDTASYRRGSYCR